MAERQLVQRGNVLPLAEYRTPSGGREYGLAVPNMLMGIVDAYNALSYASGGQQDPNAPKGYVSHNALMRGGEGIASSATLGSFATRAPAGALRSGMARSKFGQELDPSVPARAQRALDMGFEDQAHYRGMKQDYDPAQAEFKPQWFSSDPSVASSYADLSGHSPQVMPTYLRPGNMVEIDAGGARWDEIPFSAMPEELRGRIPSAYTKTGDDRGTTDSFVRWLSGPDQPDTIRFRNVQDHALGGGDPSDVTVVMNPSNIRSVNAMFDPARINETDLFAANSRNSQAAGLTMELARNNSERVRQLSDNFGKDDGNFNALFEQLKDLPADDLKQIHKEWMGFNAKSKTEALNAIRRRHENIFKADLHTRAVGDRVIGTNPLAGAFPMMWREEQ